MKEVDVSLGVDGDSRRLDKMLLGRKLKEVRNQLVIKVWSGWFA
jgi:hypothetical protein